MEKRVQYIGAGVLVAILFILFLYKRDRGIPGNQAATVLTVQPHRPSITKESDPVSSESASLNPKATSTSSTPTNAKQSLITPEMLQTSRHVVNQFQTAAKFQMPKGFDRMIFKTMEGHNDHKTAAIIGKDIEKDFLYAVVSKKGKIDLDEVKTFLIDEAADELKMDINNQVFNSSETSAAWADTGYSTARVWNLKSNTSTAVVALLTRLDQSGTDLIVFKAPSHVVKKNAALLEEILWDIKAK